MVHDAPENPDSFERDFHLNLRLLNPLVLHVPALPVKLSGLLQDTEVFFIKPTTEVPDRPSYSLFFFLWHFALSLFINS